MVTLAGADADRAGAPISLRDRWHCFAIVPDDAGPVPAGGDLPGSLGRDGRADITASTNNAAVRADGHQGVI